MPVETTPQAIRKLLRAAVASGLAPGFVACWGAPGEIWAEAWGWLGLGAGPTDPEAWYDLASLTKPLVTTTLVLLAGRHGVRLEDPLHRFLPELAGSPWGGVSVAQCLTHTAGFPAWEPLYAQGLGARAYLDRLKAVAPSHRPGEAVNYSCLGFVALGLALERIGGASLPVLFHREVVRPLRLDTRVAFAPTLGVRVALGELRLSVEARLCREHGLPCTPPPPLAGRWSCNDGNARGLGGAAGNAGLFGTAEGVFCLAQQYLAPFSSLLTAAEIELATKNWTPGMAQARGLGWQLAATPGCAAGGALPAEAFGHTGFTGTSLWVDPRRRAILVLLGNRLHPGGQTPDLHPLRRRFHTLALRGLSPKTRPPSIVAV
ncbi:MAG: beta-lactamase family protein [Thermoanaerobaculum sp.]|nr:beta-lactamase family protein [Thermoanaerobaculum sp.]MDW7968478.1 serine hydrolase domain-containing protein [Thermoanaerobaculum sp.]